MKITKILMTLSACLLVAPTAFAQNWFADLAVGYGSVDFDVENNTDTDVNLVSDDAGFTAVIGGGYYFTDSVYAKLSYADYGSVSPTVFLGQAVDFSSVRAGVGFELPLADKWALSAEVGAAMWEADANGSFLFNSGDAASASADGTDIYFRLGGAYRINEKVHVGVYADFENNDIGDTASYQLGLRYKF